MTNTAFRHICPACMGCGEVESMHPDPQQVETGPCAVCLGNGDVTLDGLAYYDRRRADDDPTYLPPVRTLVPLSDTDALHSPDPWACFGALAEVYGEDEAERLMAIQPPC